MDYRMVDEIETDYGVLVVKKKTPAFFGYTVLQLQDGHTLTLDEQGQPHPDSERELMEALRRRYETDGMFAITPLPDREEDWASDYLGGEYNDPEQEGT